MTNPRRGVMPIVGAVLLMVLVGSTEARRRPPPIVRPPRKLNLSNMSPQQIEEVARQVRNALQFACRWFAWLDVFQMLQVRWRAPPPDTRVYSTPP